MSTLPKLARADSTMAAPALGCRDAVVVGHRLASSLRDLADHGVGRVGAGAAAVDRAAEVIDDNLGPAPGQLDGIATAKTAPRAGDDRNPSVEIDLAHSL